MNKKFNNNIITSLFFKFYLPSFFKKIHPFLSHDNNLLKVTYTIVDIFRRSLTTHSSIFFIYSVFFIPFNMKKTSSIFTDNYCKTAAYYDDKSIIVGSFKYLANSLSFNILYQNSSFPIFDGTNKHT